MLGMDYLRLPYSPHSFGAFFWNPDDIIISSIMVMNWSVVHLKTPSSTRTSTPAKRPSMGMMIGEYSPTFREMSLPTSSHSKDGRSFLHGVFFWNPDDVIISSIMVMDWSVVHLKTPPFTRTSTPAKRPSGGVMIGEYSPTLREMLLSTFSHSKDGRSFLRLRTAIIDKVLVFVIVTTASKK